jgi:hypothetical protein
MSSPYELAAAHLDKQEAAYQLAEQLRREWDELEQLHPEACFQALCDSNMRRAAMIEARIKARGRT